MLAILQGIEEENHYSLTHRVSFRQCGGWVIHPSMEVEFPIGTDSTTNNNNNVIFYQNY